MIFAYNIISATRPVLQFMCRRRETSLKWMSLWYSFIEQMQSKFQRNWKIFLLFLHDLLFSWEMQPSEEIQHLYILKIQMPSEPTKILQVYKQKNSISQLPNIRLLWWNVVSENFLYSNHVWLWEVQRQVVSGQLYTRDSPRVPC